MITYIWTATCEGKQIGSGVENLTEQECVDYHGTTNILKLVNEWNRLGQLQFSMARNLPRILWTYYTI